MILRTEAPKFKLVTPIILNLMAKTSRKLFVGITGLLLIEFFSYVAFGGSYLLLFFFGQTFLTFHFHICLGKREKLCSRFRLIFVLFLGICFDLLGELQLGLCICREEWRNLVEE